jgi:hypothetical protein
VCVLCGLKKNEDAYTSDPDPILDDWYRSICHDDDDDVGGCYLIYVSYRCRVVGQRWDHGNGVNQKVKNRTNV